MLECVCCLSSAGRQHVQSYEQALVQLNRRASEHDAVGDLKRKPKHLMMTVAKVFRVQGNLDTCTLIISTGSGWCPMLRCQYKQVHVLRGAGAAILALQSLQNLLGNTIQGLLQWNQCTTWLEMQLRTCCSAHWTDRECHSHASGDKEECVVPKCFCAETKAIHGSIKQLIEKQVDEMECIHTGCL